MYPFSPQDQVVSESKCFAGPCYACGSEKHWWRDHPKRGDYDKLKEKKLVKGPSKAYKIAMYAMEALQEASEDEVSTERPSTIRKQTYLQLTTLSLSSFYIHCQETSAASLSPSHCTCKELNVDSDSSPCQESSASSETDSTNFHLPDSSREEREDRKWAAFSGASLEQFEDGVEYVESDLQGELAEAFSLAAHAEEFKSPKCDQFETSSPRVMTIVAHKCCTLLKGHTSMGIMGLCTDGCHLGKLGEEPFVACLDSGSDLTLLSEAVLNHLTRPPHIHSVRW